MSFPKAYKTKLQNGLRILIVPVKNNPTVTVQVFVEAGSRYEEKRLNGMSHFLEHMCFKGTQKRPSAKHISTELEALGASNNAFTSEEMTSYYAKARTKHFTHILDVIADLYMDPQLPAPELERERGVIIEEINMCEDQPQRTVHDLLDMVMYGDQPAGRTVLGPKENIKRFSRMDFVRYRKAHYVASKTVVVISGGIELTKTLSAAKKYFEKIPKGKRIESKPTKEVQKNPQVHVYQKKTGQTHLAFGFRAYPMNDKRSVVASVLAAVLGNGMSSRLFQKLREELGVCYYAKAAHSPSTDVGVFKIYTGVDSTRVKEIVRVIMEEVKKLREELVSRGELAKAKEILIGDVEMELESSDAFAMWYGVEETLRHKTETPEEVIKKIRGVSAKDLMRVAREMFVPEKTNLAAIGPEKVSGLEKLLTL